MTMRRRSSRLNPDQQSDDDTSIIHDFEILDRTFRLRGGAPPPPPPPPLPPRLEPSPTFQQQMVDRASQTDQEEADTVENQRQDWIFSMRTEPRKLSGRRDVVRILVRHDMNVMEFSKCILQINELPGRDDIAGLFREKDGLFMTIQDVIQEGPKAQNSVWSLSFPVKVIEMSKPLLNWSVIYVLGIGCIALVFWLFGPVLLLYLKEWSDALFNVVVNSPLRELYRYGPSAVGWEGMSLPRICARITYHGDEDFWTRNMEECNRIFAAKEDAHLHLVRPMLYFGVSLVLFYAIRSLIREWSRSRHVPKYDRDMVETFEAFHTILRQLKRATHRPDTRR